MERHFARKAKRSGKHHLKGPSKRTEEDNRRFANSFEQLIREAMNDRDLSLPDPISTISSQTIGLTGSYEK